MDSEPNVQQAVPFFMVSDIEAAVQFYVEGLGFMMTKHWSPEGKLQWCWLQHGGGALMLQEYVVDGHGAYKPEGRLGEGVTVYFMCQEALAIYHMAQERGLQPRRPFVGNAMWVVELIDPDGYHLAFESPTDVPEETAYVDA